MLYDCNSSLFVRKLIFLRHDNWPVTVISESESEMV